VADKRHFGDKSTNQIKEELEDGSKEGFRRVCFTGGEVTIRKDIVELVSFAKKTGYDEIMIQTNGRKFSSLSFTKEIVKAGANQFGLSIHGHNSQLHDYFTQRPGSFEETVKGVKNIIKTGQRVATNSVVNKLNYRFLPELAKLLVDLGVSQYQLAFIHINGAAWTNFDQLVPRISLTIPPLIKALNYGIQRRIITFTEAYPYCLIKGYELCLSEHHIPDRTIIKEYGRSYDFDPIRKNEAKMKFPQCRQCDYNNQCEGTWKEYPERFGYEEFKPITSRFKKRLGAFALQSR
jgi:MoaA/NifB/PqqE/SkfB family radical SAM enzyme